MHTVFYYWNEGQLTNLGGFQTALFQAYRLADLGNRARLDAAFPEWLTEVFELKTSISNKVRYICQLSAQEQGIIREKLRTYLEREGFTDTLEEELQNAMDSKIDDIDWRMINGYTD